MSDQDKRSRFGRLERYGGIAVLVIAGGLLVWKGVERLTDSDPTRPVAMADVIQPGDAAGYNVLLITLDTTRADHLSCYSYDRMRTPTIDSLVDHGVRFDDAVTSVPTTLASHTTILTGLYPYHHGVRNNGTYALPAGQITLTEVLKDHGYATAAFVSSFVLDKRFGLDQGFDVYDFEISDEGWRGPTCLVNDREANRVTTAALGWLETRHESASEDPFFMWVHYFDPHAPYASPLGDLPRFGDGTRESAYDAEIAFVDLHLQRLLERVDADGLRDRTLIVLVSDHGESLGEHGEYEHGAFIYEASMHAVLILSCPSLFDRPYRVDDRIVGTVDIVPTVAQLLRISLPVPVDGRGLVTAEADPQRAIYMETKYVEENMRCAPLFGLRRHTDKFILAPRPEYYDLRRDPEEVNNLYGTTDPKIEALEHQLAAIMGDWSGVTMAARTMSAEEVERLAALGYVAAGGGGGGDDLPDAKDRLPTMESLGEAKYLMDEGKYEEALVIAEEAAEQLEDLEVSAFLLAKVYVELDRREDAVRVLSRFVENYPSTSGALVFLARQLCDLKRYDEMEERLQAAEIIEPQCGAVPMLRGERLFAERRYAEALEQYHRALEMDGDRLAPGLRDRVEEARRLMDTYEP